MKFPVYSLLCQRSEVKGQRAEVRFRPQSTTSPRCGASGHLASDVAAHSLQSASAFTLIELLVVMVIAVVIMAVSLPSFISMGRGAGMRTAVNNISSTVALSRQWAITHREQITFVASSTGLVWTTNNVPVPTTNDHACYYAVSAVNPSNLIQSITDLPLDMTFGAPSVSATNLTFKTDGGLDGDVSDPSDVVLVDKKSLISPNVPIRKTISINRFTGGIKVE